MTNIYESCDKSVFFCTTLYTLQGDPSPGEPRLGWLWFGMFLPLPGSAWADGKSSKIKVNPTKVRQEMGRPVLYWQLTINVMPDVYDPWYGLFFTSCSYHGNSIRYHVMSVAAAAVQFRDTTSATIKTWCSASKGFLVCLAHPSFPRWITPSIQD